MSYSIIGLGEIGSAISKAFARKGFELTVAGRRSPAALAPLAAEIGSSLIAGTIEDAVKAEVVILAVPFAHHIEVARAAKSWKGKIVIDAMNAFGVSPEELGGLPSTAAVAKTMPGAKLVKAFNHLAAASFAVGPTVAERGRRVVFVSSDDEAASSTVAELVDRLGFAPVELGKLSEGGMLVQARGSTWGKLIFQDLIKFSDK